LDPSNRHHLKLNCRGEEGSVLPVFPAEALFIKWGSKGYITINKADITNVEVEKSFLAKKDIFTLTDGSKHTFNYGALNINKVVAAIHAK
jgi:hypothetical protein